MSPLHLKLLLFGDTPGLLSVISWGSGSHSFVEVCGQRSPTVNCKPKVGERIFVAVDQFCSWVKAESWKHGLRWMTAHGAANLRGPQTKWTACVVDQLLVIETMSCRLGAVALQFPPSQPASACWACGAPSLQLAMIIYYHWRLDMVCQPFELAPSGMCGCLDRCHCTTTCSWLPLLIIQIIDPFALHVL